MLPADSHYPPRRKFLRRTIWMVGSILGACIADGCLWEPKHPRVDRLSLRFKRLPPALEGLTVCQMSDFHRGFLVAQSEIEHAVRIANGLKPDLILLTGDYVTEQAEFARDCASALRHLSAPLGVFSVLGNHDHWTRASVVERHLEEAGIPVLRNRSVKRKRGEGFFYVVGLDDVWENKQDLKKALRDVPPEVFTVMMVHEPDYADEVAKHPVDLQLSGHSHGGQVRLPFLGAPMLPLWGTRYSCGHYTLRNLQLYTTRGVGRVYPGIRLNCPPEITLLKIMREST